MKLAFGYIRRSSYKQQENNSVEIQKSHIQEFAHRNGMEVPDEFIFIEDVTSAFSKRASKRKELMRLLHQIVESGIPRVIFYEESRMDRTGYSFVLDFYRPLQEKLPNIEVYTTNANEPFNPGDPRTQISLLLYRQESEIKSDRAIGSLIADLQNPEICRPGSKVPYGYVQHNKKLIPNENADIVTFIFYLQSWGISMSKIASILNEASIPSPQGKSWGSSTVESILKNPVYTGMLVWNIHKDKKQTFEFRDFHKPLINQFLVLLNENNIKLQQKFGRLDTPFIFLNKLSCAQCHQTLVTQNGSTTRKGKKYYYQYYVCKHCSYKLDLNEVHEDLLPKILKYVQELVSSENIKTTTTDYLHKIQVFLEENIKEIEDQLDKLISKGSIANEHNDREFALYVKTVESRLETSLESLLNSRDILEELYEAVHTNLFFDRFKQILDSELGESEKRLIILYFVDKVLVHQNRPLQPVFRENVFESFNLVPTRQSTES
ncbi:recombinase family protein [Bacillus dakarensis]|uniref:recombinase family protein n=1 Tax=Robertmurraya dakarensis TaxID=1926278 RepID=UPI000980D6DD|nr:recombinase family protein [Bacillus dakarensis]